MSFSPSNQMLICSPWNKKATKRLKCILLNEKGQQCGYIVSSMNWFSNQKYQLRKGKVNIKDCIHLPNQHRSQKDKFNIEKVPTWMMNHLKQHLKAWHCKPFVIWRFSMDKWGFTKDQFLILGQLSTYLWSTSDLQGSSCPPNGHFSLFIRWIKKRKQTLNRVPKFQWPSHW